MFTRIIYIILIGLSLYMSVLYFTYAGSIKFTQREVANNVWVTEFIEHTGGVNGRFEMTIVPSKVSSLMLVKMFYNHIFLIENDIVKYSYDRDGELSIYIPANKVYVIYRGIKKELKPNEIKEYTDFLDIKHLKIFHAKK